MELINRDALTELINEISEKAVKSYIDNHGTVEQRYLNQKNAAKFLGISVMKFSSMRKERLISPISVDGMLRYDTHDLVKFMKERAQHETI